MFGLAEVRSFNGEAILKDPTEWFPSLHLKTVTDPVSETFCLRVTLISGQWILSINPLILWAVRHRHH
jgi:hypothetical protein